MEEEEEEDPAGLSAKPWSGRGGEGGGGLFCNANVGGGGREGPLLLRMYTGDSTTRKEENSREFTLSSLNGIKIQLLSVTKKK